MYVRGGAPASRSLDPESIQAPWYVRGGKQEGWGSVDFSEGYIDISPVWVSVRGTVQGGHDPS